MTSDDRFFEKLRGDARGLQWQPDDVMMTRIAARVRAEIAEEEETTVAALLARWFRPLAASFAGLALAATIGLAVLETPQQADAEDAIEISMAGDAYSVSE